MSQDNYGIATWSDISGFPIRRGWTYDLHQVAIEPNKCVIKKDIMDYFICNISGTYDDNQLVRYLSLSIPVCTEYTLVIIGNLFRETPISCTISDLGYSVNYGTEGGGVVNYTLEGTFRFTDNEYTFPTKITVPSTVNNPISISTSGYSVSYKTSLTGSSTIGEFSVLKKGTKFTLSLLTKMIDPPVIPPIIDESGTTETTVIFNAIVPQNAYYNFFPIVTQISHGLQSENHWNYPINGWCTVNGEKATFSVQGVPIGSTLNFKISTGYGTVINQAGTYSTTLNGTSYNLFANGVTQSTWVSVLITRENQIIDIEYTKSGGVILPIT